MSRREMLDTTRRELAHIPDWPYPQGLLRAAYWNMRLNSLGGKAEVPDDPLEVVRRAIAICEKQDPAAYEYDRAFFEEESRRRRTR